MFFPSVGDPFWCLLHSSAYYGRMLVIDSDPDYGKATEHFDRAIQEIETRRDIFQDEYLCELYIKLLYKRACINNKVNPYTSNDLITAARYFKGKKNHFFYLGNVYGSFKKYKEALQFCGEGLWKDSNNYWLHYLRIYIHLRLNDKQSAFKSMIFFDKITNKDKDYFYSKGLAQICLGKYKEALKDLNEAIKLNDRNGDYFYHRGNIYGRYKHYQKAIENYDKAVKLNNNDPKFLFARGRIYVLQGNFNKAVEDLDKAIKLNNTDSECFLAMGNVLKKVGNYNEALKNLNKAIELNNSNENYFYYRNFIWVKLNKNEEALKDLDKAIELNNKDSRYFFSKSTILFRNLNKSEEALEACNKAIKLNANRSVYFYYRSFIWRKLEKYKECLQDLELFQKFRNDTPFFPERGYEAIQSKAICLYKMKKFEKARIVMQDCRELIVGYLRNGDINQGKHDEWNNRIDRMDTPMEQKMITFYKGKDFKSW